MRQIGIRTLLVGTAAVICLALGRVVFATRPDSRQPSSAPTSLPVFGVSPKAYLPLVSTASSSATLPPGARLPSDAECAVRVRQKPESRNLNAAYNSTVGNQQLGGDIFGGSDPRATTEIALRVTGRFTGTTDMILQWAACKWGIDPDIARAQAAVESWWRQSAQGDWGDDPDRCPPGHGLGVDDSLHHPNECPESWGLLQTRYPYQTSAWPGMADSSSFQVDTAYAIWRACFEGYESWLNDVEHGAAYGPGDVWGCVGRWYAGRWHTPAAEAYIAKVKAYLSVHIWEQPGFQEP